jgi:hypothetical protein
MKKALEQARKNQAERYACPAYLFKSAGNKTGFWS